MWIPLGARWDQEPAGSLVVPTPQKIAGSVAGERGGKEGEEKGGKIGMRTFFVLFLNDIFSCGRARRARRGGRAAVLWFGFCNTRSLRPRSAAAQLNDGTLSQFLRWLSSFFLFAFHSRRK